MLLEVRELSVHYVKAVALWKVNFKLEQGEIAALVGANGAGKSTFLRTISGLVRATQGEIWYQGERIDRDAPYEIVAKGIVHVPEGRRPFTTMTVQHNLEMGAYLRKDKKGIKRDIAEIFELFPILQERKNQVAGTLSGGEQQMLAFGRALMAKPLVLLADEPSAGLSPILVKEVGEVITDLNRRGMSIILVEQNTSVALSVANRAYVLQTGKIVMSGDAKEIRSGDELRKLYLGGGRERSDQASVRVRDQRDKSRSIRAE